MGKTAAGVVCVVFLSVVFLLVGCATDAQTGALAGGVLGAAAGQAIGGDTEGTLIGAGVGAAGGYMIGNERDKARAAREREMNRQMATTHIVHVQNSNGSTTPITLRRVGGRWIGPNGEEYSSLPTEQQLRAMYGR